MKKVLNYAFPVNWKKFKVLLLIMRVISFLILLGTLTVSASSYSQQVKIDLRLKDSSIEDILLSIENNSRYIFIYDAAILKSLGVKSIDVTGQKIGTILDQLFEGSNVAYKIDDRQVFLFQKDNYSFGTKLQNSQVQREVRGVVKDANGIPIPGVTVVLKGTTRGTISDATGGYLFTGVPGNATLIFSFVGMRTREVAVENQASINVTMEEETIGIEEVVAIGYGTMKKSDLTGSVVRANIDAFRESPNVSLTQSLQGAVPGLNVGQVTTAGEDASLSIRGRNTISGTTSPLIVLDGIIYRGNLVDLNPNDIESIDVLKDASAAAIYGSQASNGVIIITSKSGEDLGKPVVAYSSSFAVQLPAHEVKMGNAEDYIDKLKNMYLNVAYLAPDYAQPNPDFDVTSIMPNKAAVDGYNAGVETDWWNLLTKDKGSVMDHTISIRGKSNLSSYFFSVGHVDQTNIIINDKFKRYSIRLNLENKITNWMKLGVQSLLTSSDYSGAGPSVGSVQNLLPIVPAYDTDNNIIQYPFAAKINPLLQIENDELDKRLNLLGNFYADIDIPFIKGLNYRANYSQNVIISRHYFFDKTASNFQGSASKEQSHGYNWTFDNILTYKRNFGIHAVNATLVYGVESLENEGTKATANIFQNDALGYNNLGAGQADQRGVSSSAWDEHSLYTMGRLHYGYKSKYLATVTLRRDGFSGFGANNKIGYFPSMAIGWVVSEENFLKNNFDWINQLKLRYSRGTSGNRTIKRYETLAKLSSATRYLYGDGATPEMAQWVSSLANSDLKWERTTSSNIGIDYALFDNRLSGYLEGYVGNTSNLLYNLDIPVVNGFENVATNIGKMKNRGVELSVTGVPVKSKDFQWNLSVNFSLNRNEVVSIKRIDLNADGIEDNIISSDAGKSILIGEPYDIWYDYDITGMWQIADGANIPAGFAFGTYKIRDISGPDGAPDGSWTPAYDRTLIGYKDPSYRFSIMNSVQFKQLEFRFFINSIQGGDQYYKAVAAGNWANIDNLRGSNHPNWDWWSPENPDAKYRRLGDYPRPVGETVHPYSSRSFIRLQDVSLSYQFKPQILASLGIRYLKCYLSGKNLLTWTNWEGWDPETGAGVGGSPVMKSYSVGLDVEF